MKLNYRTGKTAVVTVRTDEEDDVTEYGTADDPFSVFNPKENTQFFIGGAPDYSVVGSKEIPKIIKD